MVLYKYSFLSFPFRLPSAPKENLWGYLTQVSYIPDTLLVTQLTVQSTEKEQLPAILTINVSSLAHPAPKI